MRLSEFEFLTALRGLATHPAARGLLDDAAVLEVGAARLVLTHDMIVEGMHYLPGDPPADVAWKLLAVNLSDLAAKGARPVGVLLGYGLGDAAWDRAFVAGLGSALAAIGIPLLGGDTVATPAGSARHLGLTAIGQASIDPPARSAAQDGDILWVTGAIGDAGAGLRIARGDLEGDPALVERYRLPHPRLEAGQALAPLVSAMMDVSDGLLLDAERLAQASRLAVEISLDDVPLSAAYIACCGEDLDARMTAATAGDDYELLFAAPADASNTILTLADDLGLPISRIGRLGAGSGLTLQYDSTPVPLPPSLGYRHG